MTAVVLAAIGACADSVKGPTGLLAPESISLVPGIGDPKIIEVCIDLASPAGTYTIDVSAVTSAAGDIVVDPVVITINPGPQCGIAFFRPGNDQSIAQVTLTASTAAAGTFSYTCVDNIQVPAPPAEPLCVGGTSGTNGAVAQANGFHGSTVTFLFVAAPPPPPPPPPPSVGCTFTQGYWKNKGAASTAQFDFDGGVNNGLTILQTAPRGNPYLILAHQYIAAALNMANGASIDGAALTAFDAATAYFEVASAAGPLPAGYTKDVVTSLATALDTYNNGLSGPPHCE